MYREKLKSITLFSLVLLSIILTARIWFDSSIEGIFVMFTNNGQAVASSTFYNNSNLIKPDCIFLNYGKQQTMQLDAGKSPELYNKVFDNAKTILKKLANEPLQTPVAKKADIDGWYKLREDRNIELSFGFHMTTADFMFLLGIDKNPWTEIKYVDEIIFSEGQNKVYIMDKSQNAYFEISMSNAQANLEYLLSEAENQSTLPLVWFNELNPKLYSEDAIAPIYGSLPTLLEQRDLSIETLTPDNTTPAAVAAFFDKNAIISQIKNNDGTYAYTDREEKEEKWVRVDTKGVLEYTRYDLTPSADTSVASEQDAAKISIEFANSHLGLPDNCYISAIEKNMLEGKLVGYTIKFNYRYKGIPVILNEDKNTSYIEIEVVGKEVKRYKRVARCITEEMDIRTIMNPVDAHNILFDYKVSGENITQVNRMYIAYLERDNLSKLYFIPVWIVDATVEIQGVNGSKNQEKQYIIDAESGLILYTQ